jgi:beta-galactosidase
MEVPEFSLDEAASLWQNLPDPISVQRPRSMEAFRQSYGYILYRTKLAAPAAGDLVLPELRSYAQVFVNGRLVGALDRRSKQDRMHLDAGAGAILDILVEGTGRINFSAELRSERQGLNSPVILAGHELTGWQVFPLPMNDLSNPHLSFRESSKGSIGPAFYRGHFDLQTLGDTFLDMRGWGKGAVWVNGHALGRFWNLGPQQTLYAPAPWLKKGTNEVAVFTLGGRSLRLRGLRAPILNELGSE